MWEPRPFLQRAHRESNCSSQEYRYQDINTVHHTHQCTSIVITSRSHPHVLYHNNRRINRRQNPSTERPCQVLPCRRHLPYLYEPSQRSFQGRTDVDGFAPDTRRTTVVSTPIGTSMLIITNTNSNGAFAVARHVVTLVGQNITPRHVLNLAFAHGTTNRLLRHISTTITNSVTNSAATAISSQTFLGPTVFACSTFFRAVIHRCKLLIKFSRGARPLDTTKTLRLTARIVSDRVSLTFDRSFNTFSDLTGHILTLSSTVNDTVVNTNYADFSSTVGQMQR